MEKRERERESYIKIVIYTSLFLFFETIEWKDDRAIRGMEFLSERGRVNDDKV